MIQIHKTIKRERLRRGMTQEKLAEYLKTSKTTISKWENGALYPDITLLPQLSKIFNISIDSLLNDKSELTSTEMADISLKLSNMIDHTSYEDYLITIKEYYLNHANEFKFLNSLLSILTNNILYCHDETLFKQTINLSNEIIKTTEDNCESIHLIKHAQGYKTLLYTLDNNVQAVIDTTPDFDLKLGEQALLCLSYIQQNNIEKAKNVLHADMYQSLMVFVHEFTIMLLYKLHTLPIESLEETFDHFNKAFNVDFLFPLMSMNCYYHFALHYAKYNEEKAITHLGHYCQCLSRLTQSFTYQSDDMFTHITEWCNTLPLGKRLPTNYENTLKTVVYKILENKTFLSLNRFEEIKRKLLHIYNQRSL
ncbi:helix-turn-helix transcriptional regulator [Staphylococcus hyicus]|uniref:helix-turn-helix domain-containing protein n=1 Tax=Staphylococcus hyicus TaxID=1284 RepID=UPI00208EA626|nr:helix-turn-helix transcriptional regulator [Staphylococcus hyicus]MCO4329722.1 helix-turn-helix transcriptional regulator [Staphylococcus hyicus]MCO4337287.1 helix-turn-helix transcriptional regulator [Staphylococcus hyicus]MDP4460558.1 helix-turn-helix transcriptional regulator [Staphylococcus hyicus]